MHLRWSLVGLNTIQMPGLLSERVQHAPGKLYLQLSFFPPKIRYFKKSFICTIVHVVSRQIHVLTDTRMLRTILGRTFMAATLQHSTLLPGNGSVCDSILELYAILEFHNARRSLFKNISLLFKRQIAPCLIRSTCLTFSRCENSGPVQSVLYRAVSHPYCMLFNCQI